MKGTTMDTLKNIWNHVNEYVEEHDIWLVPAFLFAGFVGLVIVISIIPDPKPVVDDLETVKTYIVKMDYEGHSYLLYKRLGYVSLCHDENCKCKKQ